LERFSISLPGNIAEFLRSRAEIRREAMSTIIADALVRLERDERRALSIEALLANAELDQKLAEEAIISARPPQLPGHIEEGRGSVPVEAPPKSRHSGASRNRHVVPTGDGRWAVQKEGSPRKIATYATQREAVIQGREVLRHSGGGELVTHSKDGRIRDSDIVAPRDNLSPSKNTK
jgi:hypothetical protein